jgi:DNA-binding response OmpR family regulator
MFLFHATLQKTEIASPKNKMKVAIIEDEKNIIDAVSVAFEFRWPEVKLVSATTGSRGLKLIREERPDIVILDINLPDINGFDVMQEIRAFSSVPVIILTVRSNDSDVLRGLEAGADDYIVKPFNYLTLLARVRAVLRRIDAPSLRDDRDTVVSRRLKIDFINQRVTVDDHIIRLTPGEYRVLVHLVKNKGNVITYERMTEDLWGKKFRGNTENIRIFIRRLRKKLMDNPPEMILNQRNAGYIFKG